MGRPTARAVREQAVAPSPPTTRRFDAAADPGFSSRTRWAGTTSSPRRASGSEGPRTSWLSWRHDSACAVLMASVTAGLFSVGRPLPRCRGATRCARARIAPSTWGRGRREPNGRSTVRAPALDWAHPRDRSFAHTHDVVLGAIPLACASRQAQRPVRRLGLVRPIRGSRTRSARGHNAAASQGAWRSVSPATGTEWGRHLELALAAMASAPACPHQRLA